MEEKLNALHLHQRHSRIALFAIVAFLVLFSIAVIVFAKTIQQQQAFNSSSSAFENSNIQTLTATQDVHVNSDQPARNFNSKDELQVRSNSSGGPEYQTYISFTAPSSRDLLYKMVLRLYIKDGKDKAGLIYETNPSQTWNQNTLTWTNKPSLLEPLLVSSNLKVKKKTWIEYDVTEWANRNSYRWKEGQVISFAIVGNSKSSIKFDSSETSNKPQLIGYFQSGGAPSPQAPTPIQNPLPTASGCVDDSDCEVLCINPPCGNPRACVNGMCQNVDIGMPPAYQVGCLACDFSTPSDGRFDSNDALALNRCIFSDSCRATRDPNSDGKLDAGDTAWCPLNCANQTTTQSLNIRRGWNLLSLYLDPTDPRPASVFAPLFEANSGLDGSSTYITSIFTYENGTWKTYVNERPFQSLTQVKAGQGMFIYSHVDLTMNVTGVVPITKMPPIKEDSYNLVGITSATAQPISALISRTQYPDLKIWKLISVDNPSSFTLIVSPDISNNVEPKLEPGVGYWVHPNLPIGSPAIVPASPGGPSSN